MMLSVMVVGAGAAFSDQSKIKNTEAVDACTALNIIGGYPDGSFKPEGNITRAEVTKMICVALNGGKNPAVSTNTTPTFSDVRNNANAAWAEGYIESCAAQGIVSGVGGGKFAPNGNVTGVQLAKMLLVSLGYKSENEGFTGNAWATNVNVRAAQKGLYKGLEKMDTNAAITRDNAAQMVWNALNAYEVEYKTTLVADKNGQLTSQITVQDKVDGNFKKITLMQDKYEAETFVGTFEGNSKVLTLKDGQIQVENSETGEKVQKTATFTYDLDLKYIGEEVKVLYKDNVNDGQKGKLDDKDTIYGVYVTGGTSVVNATLNDIDNDYDTADKVSVNDKAYKVAKNGKIVTNLVSATSGAAWTSKSAAKTDIQRLHKVNGDTVKFVLNDSNEIISAYVTTSDLYKVTAVSGKKVSLAGIGTVDTAENDSTVYSGIAKDDVVAVTALYYGVKDTDNATYVITKAESVAGKVTGYAGTKNVTMDGKTYKFYNETDLKQNLTDDSVAKFTTDDVDDSFTLYLVNGYVRAAQKGDEDMNSYALVTDLNSGKLDSTFDEPKAELLLADGTKKTVVLHKDSKIYTDASHGLETLLNKNAAINSTNALDKGTLVKYVEMSNGQYKIEECGTYTTTSASTEMYNKDTKTFTTGGTKTVTDGNCALFYTNSSKEYKAANIRNLNTFSVASGKDYAYVTNSDGKVVAAFIDMSAKPSGAASETLYGIITNDGTVTNKNGDTYTMYNIWTGKDTVVYVDGDQKDASDVALAKGQLVSFDESADQTYTQDKAGTHDFTILDGTATVPAKGQAIAVTDYNEKDKTITFATKLKVEGDAYVADGKTTKAIDNDVKIVYINADKDKAGDDGMGITSFDGTTGYANAMIVYEDNNINKKVVAIIVNTNSDTDVLGNKTIASAKSVTKPADGTGYTVSVDKTKAVKGDVITLTFTSTVAAGATADKLTVTPTGATAATAGATSVTFEANAKAGTVKTLKFVANGNADISFNVSGNITNDITTPVGP